MRIDVHHHFHGLDDCIVQRLDELKELIMTTQAELASQLNDVTALVTKIGTETQSLLDKITALEAALANAANVTPEVQAAFDALKAQAGVVDGLVPDAP